jgi:hypothetical protein
VRAGATARKLCRNPRATKARYFRQHGSGTSPCARRSKTSTPVSTEGDGSKLALGSRRPTELEYQAPQRTPLRVLGQGSARLTATAHSTMRSARTSRMPGSSSRWRRMSVVRSKGRLATTRKGLEGSSTDAASPWTTSTFAQRPRRAPAHRASSSTARTRWAARASSVVSRPLPAPRSSTSSSGCTPASRTRSAARACERRKCWLRARPGRRAPRARRSDTNHHGRHHRLRTMIRVAKPNYRCQQRATPRMYGAEVIVSTDDE